VTGVLWKAARSHERLVVVLVGGISRAKALGINWKGPQIRLSGDPEVVLVLVSKQAVEVSEAEAFRSCLAPSAVFGALGECFSDNRFHPPLTVAGLC
jgi:hypothetical protein